MTPIDFLDPAGEYVTLRIPPADVQRIEALAERAEKGVAEWIAWAVAMQVRAEEGKQ